MTSKTKTPRRIGIYSGSFDPVHAGHLSFALQALAAGQLDEVYFLPERRPRSKTGVEHFGHRVAMLQKAVRPHRRLKVLELEDVSFTVRSTLPRLRKLFPDAQLVFLVGSDVVTYVPQWPYASQLLQSCELIVGVRAADLLQLTQRAIADWPMQPAGLIIINSYAKSISSRRVRQALRDRRYVPGVLQSVQRYSNHNWLYVSLANSGKLQQKSQ